MPTRQTLRSSLALLTALTVAACLLACDPSDDDKTIPGDLSSLYIDLFDGAIGPWDILRVDLAATPVAYRFTLSGYEIPGCERTGSLTAAEEQELRAVLGQLRYAQFENESTSVDQAYRLISFEHDGDRTNVYHLFDIDWEQEVYPAANFYYATAGAEQLIDTAMRIAGGCD